MDVTPACPVVRRRPRPAERVELALVALVVAAAAVAAPSSLAWSLPLGKLVAYAAVVLLAQGLVRDVARLVWRRARGAAAPAVTQRALCLCAESSVGLILVTSGVLLSLVGVEQRVVLGRAPLALGLLGLFMFGFVAKDWVLVLRRVEDHATVAPGWPTSPGRGPEPLAPLQSPG